MRLNSLFVCLLVGACAAWPGSPLAAQCKVSRDAVPDVTHLQEENRKRAELRPLLRDKERIVGELNATQIPKTKVARPTPAQQRVLDDPAHAQWDAQDRDKLLFQDGDKLLPSKARPSSTRKVTFQDGGQSYTVTVMANIPDSIAIESARRQRAYEAKIGPEKNPLILAVATGEAQKVKELIAQGVDVRTVLDRHGKPTAIIAAAVSRWYGTAYDSDDLSRQAKEAPSFVAITKMLVEAGANVTGALARIASGNRRTTDPTAAPELAAYLLQHGATLTDSNLGGRYSVLDLVAESGNQDLFAVMLRHGKPTQEQKNSALVTAIDQRQYGSAQMALEAGADPNLLPSAFGKCCEEPIIGKLLPFSDGFSQGIVGAPRELLKAMVRHKFNPNVVVGNYNTPLMAVIHDHELMADFLNLGADPNAVRSRPYADASNGYTALDFAIAFERNPPYGNPILAYSPRIRARSVELLLRHGANPKLADKAGVTPLMRTTSDDGPVIALLLAAGATINTDVGRTEQEKKNGLAIGPVTWSLMNGNETLATALVRRNKQAQASDCGAVYYAARSGATTTLNALLDLHANMGVSEESGETPLIGAAAAGHASTVQVLLQRQAALVNEYSRVPASVNPSERQIGGVTPLMAAARGGWTDVVELLLKSGAKVEQRDRVGRTALDYASARGNQPDRRIVQALTPQDTLSRKTPENRDFVAKVSEAIKRQLVLRSSDVTLNLAPRTHPVLPGDDSGYERLECERLAAFTINGAADALGALSVSVCTLQAQRARQLAAHQVQSLLAPQTGGGAEWEESWARKAGLHAAQHTLTDGSDFYLFPVVEIGHGLFVSYTAVLYNPKSKQTVIVQNFTQPMCGQEKYQDVSLCKTPEQALQKLAFEVLRGY